MNILQRNILTLLSGTLSLQAQDMLVATPAKPEIIAGGIIQVVVSLGKTPIKWADYDDPKVSDAPTGVLPLRPEPQEDGKLLLQAPPSIRKDLRFVTFAVTITKKSDTGTKLDLPVTILGQSTLDWDARAIVGWHQAGG